MKTSRSKGNLFSKMAFLPLLILSGTSWARSSYQTLEMVNLSPGEERCSQHYTCTQVSVSTTTMDFMLDIDFCDNLPNLFEVYEGDLSNQVAQLPTPYAYNGPSFYNAFSNYCTEGAHIPLTMIPATTMSAQNKYRVKFINPTNHQMSFILRGSCDVGQITLVPTISSPQHDRVCPDPVLGIGQNSGGGAPTTTLPSPSPARYLKVGDSLYARDFPEVSTFRVINLGGSLLSPKYMQKFSFSLPGLYKILADTGEVFSVLVSP